MRTFRRRLHNFLVQQVGRRGGFLAFLAVLDVSYGWALMTTSVPVLKLAPDLFLSYYLWGWIWFLTGIFLATGICIRQDWPQYTAAAVLNAAWGLVMVDVWLVQKGPDAWVSVVIWLSFSLIVVLVGSWPEQPRYTLPTLPEMDLGGLEGK